MKKYETGVWPVMAFTFLLSCHSASGSKLEWQQWFQTGLKSGDRVGAVIVEISDGKPGWMQLGSVSKSLDKQPTANTPFEIGSITKVFTNLVLAELVHEGIITYETTVASILPQIRFANEEVGEITMLQLATHTSGLPRLPGNLQPANMSDPYADYNESLLLEELANVRKDQKLVKQYSYSNLGVGLLGYLLGVVDKSDYASTLRNRVLLPLGLKKVAIGCEAGAAIGHSGQSEVAYWYLDSLSGAGALCASAADLLVLLTSYLNNSSPLQHALVEDLEPVVDSGRLQLSRVWHITGSGDDAVYWHNGGTGGFRSFVGFNPIRKKGLIVLSNTDVDVTSVAMQALTEGIDKDQPKETTPKKYTQYEGHYLLTPSFSISIFEKSGILLAQATGQPVLTLALSKANRFNVQEVDAQIEFVVNENGDVESLILHQSGVSQPGKRVLEPVTLKSFTSIEMSREKLDAYVGQYQLAPGMIFTIETKGKQLTAQLTGQLSMPVYPHALDEFFYKVVDAQLSFKRNAAGKVNSLVLHQNGAHQVAEKMAD